MKDRRLLVALVLTATVAALIFSMRRSETRQPTGPLPEGLPANSALASATAEVPSLKGVRTPVEEQLVVSRSDSYGQGGEEASDPLAPWLRRLREIELTHDYHDQAWPLLESMAALKNVEGVPERLAAVARGTERDSDRVRGGCLIALALADSAEALAVTEETLLESSRELERAAWISLGLLSKGPVGMPVSLAQFRKPGGLNTFPARITRQAPPLWIERAIQRVQHPVPADLMKVSIEPNGNLPRLEEQFTRSIVVLMILGPSAGTGGHAREAMLRWLRGTAPLAWLADAAVLHCLALAARDDEAMAELLLEIAGERLFEPDGTAILEALVRLGGHGGLVLDHLRGFFASESAISGDALYALTQAQAVAALMPLLSAEDLDLQAKASQLVIERLSDPQLDSTERLLFLTTLASSRGDLILDAVQALLPETASQERIQDTVMFLDSVPADQRTATQDLLLTLLGRQGLSADSRLAILREIWQVKAEGSTDLLVTLRSMEEDPRAQAFLDEILGSRR